MGRAIDLPQTRSLIPERTARRLNSICERETLRIQATGKSHLCQGIGLALIRSGMEVYYRSIFDVVRDFRHDEAMEGHERVLDRYLKFKRTRRGGTFYEHRSS